MYCSLVQQLLKELQCICAGLADSRFFSLCIGMQLGMLIRSSAIPDYIITAQILLPPFLAKDLFGYDAVLCTEVIDGVVCHVRRSTDIEH
jgi:hypothetical protein